MRFVRTARATAACPAPVAAPSARPQRRRTPAAIAALVATAILATGCGATVSGSSSAGSSSAGSSSVSSSVSLAGGSTSASGAQAQTLAATTSSADFLSSDEIHEVSITFDQATYDAMVATFNDTGDKEWIEVTVTIDGTTYTQVGARLKGNSSLRSVSTDTDPASLPWLIDLDRFVDGQEHDGMSAFILRGNSTETALNEAVALDLLREAGLASEQAALVRLSVNGSAETLRLVVEKLDGDWQEANFESDGILYKAESTGDYTYRGADAASYEDVFDQETGDEDLSPLIGFLDFVNNADDATFAAELSQHLDVEAFARYLAFEELVDNFDDIDGPGNNSYLFWDATTGQFTVVAWDHNLAFGQTPGMGDAGGVGGPMGGQRPTGGAAPAAGQAGGGFSSTSNPLVTRFLAVAEFARLVEDAKASLQASLYDDGTAQSSLATWAQLIQAQASDLVSSQTLASEQAAIAAYFS